MPISTCAVRIAFMADLPAGLAGWGVAADRIHTETFGAGPVVDAGHRRDTRSNPPHLPTGATWHRTPRVLRAQRAECSLGLASIQSLLELAEACDVPVRWSCRTGVCHNCETALVAGTVAYQPDPVEPPADGNVLICCSQPQGDIVIDL